MAMADGLGSPEHIQVLVDEALWGDEKETGRAPLSPRQIEVLELAADGLDNGRIAAVLGISEETVKTHWKHARYRLGARNGKHAVAVALSRGLIAFRDRGR